MSLHHDPDPSKLARELRLLIRGDVLIEDWQRAMYATDASCYEIVPTCVVIPKGKEDVVQVVRYAYEHKMPLTARGGGSGLAGQALTKGIVIDFSTHLNRILQFDEESSTITVETGVYKGDVDAYLKARGKFLPPDPASSQYCTIGGLIATNGAGPHTVKYGNMIQYVVSLEVVLPNGEVIMTHPVAIDSSEFKLILSAKTLEGEIYRKLHELLEKHGETIRMAQPKVRKNVCGYRLERVINDGYFDLGQLIVGSEGTLGIILEAKMRVLDIPKATSLALLYFDDLEKMDVAVGKIGLLKFTPSAVEFFDQAVIERAKAVYPEIARSVPSETHVALAVEFDGNGREEVESQLDAAKPFLNSCDAISVEFGSERKRVEQLWQIRKKAVGLVMKIRGKRKPLWFVADIVVPAIHLGKFIGRIHDTCAKYGFEAVVYGHAGDGHMHIRPLLSLQDEKEINLVTKVAQEIFELGTSLGGSISGEHGDGLARSEYTRLVYGQEVADLFMRVKNLFDSRGIMNPDKKPKGSPGLLIQNLRYGTDYKRRQITPALNWSIKENRVIRKITCYDEELDYASEVELCHGCGQCRSRSYENRMCPVYKGLGNEIDSCRGRNNLLRWMLKLAGLAEDFALTDEYRDAIYKHCIQCKMCHIECLSNVNVAKLMAEARARYADVKGIPKGYSFFIDIDKYGRMGSKMAPASNWLFANPIFRYGMEVATGISRKRRFPAFSRPTFEERFAKHVCPSGDRMEVVFFYDTYINFNNPQLGMTIVDVLEANGCRVICPSQKSSGLPALIEGAPEKGRKIALYNIEQLAPYAKRGVPIVCFSPSAGIALKMEYENVVNGLDVRTVAENTMDLHEFLWNLHQRELLVAPMKPVKRHVNLHFHCHTLVQKVEPEVKNALGLIPDLKYEVLERGCCGIGGSYGFIKGNLENSMKIGSDLFNAVRASNLPTYSTGESCKMQIEQGSGREIRLTIELIAESLGLLRDS